MKLTWKRIGKFQDMIWNWWKDNRRDLPWRRTNDPYKVFVSEVMLQQTQVSRVLLKYEEFLYFFPDVEALALTTASRILRVWKGMGYNRRALYLHKTARILINKYEGALPQDEKTLCTLPGIGIYTARAILVFAYKRNLSFVDTNIRRIITHFFFRDKLQKESRIREVAAQLLPENKAREWHQALMDYGSLQLREVKPKHSESKRRAIVPFRQSDRFYRGRIIDILRNADMRQSVLINELINLYGKDMKFYRPILAQLVHEGLVVYKKESCVGLPD